MISLTNGRRHVLTGRRQRESVRVIHLEVIGVEIRLETQ